MGVFFNTEITEEARRRILTRGFGSLGVTRSSRGANQRDGARPRLASEGSAKDAGLEKLDVEVYQEPDVQPRKAEIGQELSLVNRK